MWVKYLVLSFTHCGIPSTSDSLRINPITLPWWTLYFGTQPYFVMQKKLPDPPTAQLLISLTSAYSVVFNYLRLHGDCFNYGNPVIIMQLMPRSFQGDQCGSRDGASKYDSINIGDNRTCLRCLIISFDKLTHHFR